tara:strand:- start:319 stop:669 length:351 start_codon:yes stop_codon:yes gene_type:complete
MVDLKSFLIGIAFFLGAHILTWFQLNGQFFSEWFKNNNFLVALCGIPISYLFIFGTKYTFDAFDGLIWPGRFIGFSIGMLIFAILAAQIMGEGLTNKTIVSLILCFFLVGVQVLWK